MSDTETELPETPAKPTVDPHLEHTKRITLERIVSHMNGVGSNKVSLYPEPEVRTWDIQKIEAEALLAVTTVTLPDILRIAPTILGVTVVHKGEANEATRIEQVVEKAQIIKANSDALLAVGIYVNGLRARADDRIQAAVSVSEVFTIEAEIFTELETFRSLHGV